MPIFDVGATGVRARDKPCLDWGSGKEWSR